MNRDRDLVDLTRLNGKSSEHVPAPVRTTREVTSTLSVSSGNASGAPGEWNAEFEPRNESISVDDILASLWRRKVTLLCIAFAGLIAAAVLTLMRPPVYRARTSVRLEAVDERYQNMGDVLPGASAASNVPNEAYLQNELKVLDSETLAKRVADHLELAAPRHRQSMVSRVLPAALLARLDRGRQPESEDELRIAVVKRALTIRSSLKSQVVEIFFDSQDPALAARGANAVVSEYMAINHEARLRTTRDTTEWLAGQITDLKAKLDRGNDELQALSRSTGLLYTGNQGLLSEQSVREVEEQLSKAHADRAARQSRYETALSNSPQSLPNGADSGLLREYEGSLAGLRRELTQLQ
jgi:succinoglycan biosynthesis transport protein ExoP